ncbi:MAG: FAD-binding protein [Clostridia bacterium]|nr:FAD-binding protein [Clostridia bacterium]
MTRKLARPASPSGSGSSHADLLTCSVRLPLGHSPAELTRAIARAFQCPAGQPGDWHIVRKSIDARHKGDIRIQYTISKGLASPKPAGLGAIPAFKPVFKPRACFPDLTEAERPVIIGSGPAGLFAALALAKAGLKPRVIERGQPIAARKVAVDRFWSGGPLDAENNVQFGEGGAGTFSDGKLTTNLKDPRCQAVLEELVLAGAPANILVEPKPHVGTDLLCGVVTTIRQQIEMLGGTFHFGTRLEDLVCVAASHMGVPDKEGASGETGPVGKLEKIIVSSQRADGTRQQETWVVRDVVLAIGHSARDTVQMLGRHNIPLAAKPFSVGVRIEHLQSRINLSQYGPQAGHPDLPPAEYKLAIHLPSGRSVYTFCMCPGGQVVGSASEPGGLVTNGMSFHARDQANANSALLVEVRPEDFPEPGPLGGISLQRQMERIAFDLGGRNYRAPAQLVGDFLSSRPSTGPGDVLPSYTPGVTWTDLALCLPAFIVQALREALPLLDRKLTGFASPEAVLTGVETRSSSPVRILREDTFQSRCLGLYPCGEGAGYAGGIMSAAVDGLRCAEAVLQSRGSLA